MNKIIKAIEILKKNKIFEAFEFYNNRIMPYHTPLIRSIKDIKFFKYDNIFKTTSFEYSKKVIEFSFTRHGGEMYQNDGSIFNLRKYGLFNLKWKNETVLEIETTVDGIFSFDTSTNCLHEVKLNSEWMNAINYFYKEISKIIYKFDKEEKQKIENIKKKNIEDNIDLGDFDN